MKRKLVLLLKGALMLALCLYIASYAFFRYQHTIVHTIGAVHADGGETPVYTMHDVQGGDAAVIGAYINYSIACIFTPLCLLEKAAWHCIAPLGTPLSAKHLKQEQESGYFLDH